MKENKEYAQFFPIKQRIYKKLLTYFIKRGTYIYTILLKSSQITHGTRDNVAGVVFRGSSTQVCELAYIREDDPIFWGAGYTLLKLFEIVWYSFTYNITFFFQLMHFFNHHSATSYVGVVTLLSSTTPNNFDMFSSYG